LMDRFRAVTDDANCRPAAWEGPGYVASALMRRHGIPRRKDRPPVPDAVSTAAIAAYYGGRFELFQFGEIGKAYSYDINSAYPAAMLGLPCLLHGSWEEVRGRARERLPGTGQGTYLAHVHFTKRDTMVCDLPIRTREHRIVWPREGSGWYWGVEIDAAVRAGTRVRVDRAWRYVPACDCKPFGWVPDLYAERKRIGKGGKGIVLKLGINSLYGKTAQSVGSAPYASPIWAGLITATTRATIIDAYRRIPGDALTMIATDGIYTRAPIPGLPISGDLGAWEEGGSPDLLTVQPGCYFEGAEKVRSRGVNRSTFGPHRERFRAEIRRALRAGGPTLGSVTIPVQTFCGLSLALHLGKPEYAGRWETVPREIAFDHTTKRAARWRRVGAYAQTYTQSGGAESVPYDRDFGASADSEYLADRLAVNDAADYTPRLPGG
ncbi:MAG TPA: DNA polymerase, partial [Bryobacteraceae bacterium]|nr:DNA polymerase [Bryobacteraceae bacterium]